MSDPLESSFAGLRGQRPPAPFAPTDHIRRRGRRRTRRQAVLAGVAALAVTGVGAGSVAATVGGPGAGPPVAAPATVAPSSPPPRTTSPLPTEPAPWTVLDQWLVTASDLGPGQWRSDGWAPEWAEGPDLWRWEGVCPGYRSEDYRSLAARTGQRTIAWTDGPFDQSDVPRWIHQIFDLFASTNVAEDHLDDIRAVLALCDADAETPVSFQITDTGFAGDEAVLIQQRTEVENGVVENYTVVVRMSEVVMTLHGYDPTSGHANPEFLQEVAQHATDHLP